MADIKIALRELKEDVDSGAPAASAAALSRPRRPLVAVAALSLVVLAGVIGVLVWRNRSAGPTATVPAPSLFTAIPLIDVPGTRTATVILTRWQLGRFRLPSPKI